MAHAYSDSLRNRARDDVAGPRANHPFGSLAHRRPRIQRLAIRLATGHGCRLVRTRIQAEPERRFRQTGKQSSRIGDFLRVPLPLHLFSWTYARYRLAACNASGCARSAEVSVSNLRLDAVGYFKAATSTSNLGFGSDTDITPDGLNFVAAASGDAMDSAGNPTGAVYVFRRSSGGQWVQRARLLPTVAPVHARRWKHDECAHQRRRQHGGARHAELLPRSRRRRRAGQRQRRGVHLPLQRYLVGPVAAVRSGGRARQLRRLAERQRHGRSHRGRQRRVRGSGGPEARVHLSQREWYLAADPRHPVDSWQRLLRQRRDERRRFDAGAELPPAHGRRVAELRASLLRPQLDDPRGDAARRSTRPAT